MRTSRIQGLDGLRGVAVLVVVAHHILGYLMPEAQMVPGGFLGVDLFMVLSGFLITGIVVRGLDQPRWATRFYRRRAVRLLPALFAMLAVVCLLDVVGVLGQPGDLGRTLIAVALYVFNYAKAEGLHASSYLNHLWSLAVEEQFYLVWPLMLAVVGPARRVHLAVVLTFVVAVLRSAAVEAGVDLVELHTLAHARADTFLIGALLFLASGWRRALARAAWPGFAVFAWCVLVLEPYTTGLESWGLVGVALACAAMVAGVVEGTWAPRWLRWRPLTCVGVVSYGLYLWHFPVIFLIGGDLGWTGPGAIVLSIAVSAAATGISWALVETNAWRVLDRDRLRLEWPSGT